MLFWYKVDDRINYVFPRYPASLNQILADPRFLPSECKTPNKYGSKLKHWLWQGMVDILAALKFFHFPDTNNIPGFTGNLIAAHFDLKPANILVDDSGNCIITDFGQARMRGIVPGGLTSLTALMGDTNYQPPIPPYSQRQYRDHERGPPLSRAYDVWSVACIMTEVIEYITNRGSEGFRNFQAARRGEDPTSQAFWKDSSQTVQQTVNYKLRQSVQDALDRFRSFQDQYLNTVTVLLEQMFDINPLNRPTIADCLEIVSQDLPADEWPLLDDGELSISGLGTNPQLRNMYVVL